MSRKSIVTVALAIGIPTAYGLVLRLFYGVDTWSELFNVMTVTFLVLSPLVMGALLVWLSPKHLAASYAWVILGPWIPILLLFVITLAVQIEGWACWLMILPVFLVMASAGGFIGRALNDWRNRNRLNMSLLALLPLLISPVEAWIGAMPGTYEAYTFIDIEAPADKIWSEVTRVREIPQEQDSGDLTRFLGFPRPVSAELDTLAVGCYRKAVFTGGLVFHETVTEYVDQELMVFDIKAIPHEIPSTTLDEHVVIGGEFFDVLNGSYALEDLGGGLHRLHLSSRFEVNTTFNFYAGWWARWIMKDIQQNILRVEKLRAEGS